MTARRVTARGLLVTGMFAAPVVMARAGDRALRHYEGPW